ncbi:MAG: TRIC cation channel family protein [Oscillospiraceae bacterium]|nr:TRIC cation channel family protein [Oscillospiraceae bacterium]
MDFDSLLFLCVELVGTVAFSLSGTVVAIQKRLDLFGALVLGVVTAVGGGMLRDITLGLTPPSLFRHPVYVMTAAVTSLAFFWLCYFRGDSLEHVNRGAAGRLMLLMDSLGLGIFTVVGINTAVSAGRGGNGFLCVTVGVLTGVGGGMLRDVLATRIPVILHKHVYAVAAIAGGILYFHARRWIPELPALLLGIGSIVCIRLCASHFKWDLPRIPASDKK